VAGGDFPHLAALLDSDLPASDDDVERGLHWLLDGFAQELRQTSNEQFARSST